MYQKHDTHMSAHWGYKQGMCSNKSSSGHFLAFDQIKKIDDMLCALYYAVSDQCGYSIIIEHSRQMAQQGKVWRSLYIEVGNLLTQHTLRMIFCWLSISFSIDFWRGPRFSDSECLYIADFTMASEKIQWVSFFEKHPFPAYYRYVTH